MIKLTFIGTIEQIVDAVMTGCQHLKCKFDRNILIAAILNHKKKDDQQSMLDRLDTDIRTEWWKKIRDKIADIRYARYCEGYITLLIPYINSKGEWNGAYFRINTEKKRLIVIGYDKEDCTSVFTRILYKLAGDFRNLRMEIEIDGTKVKLGSFLAAHFHRIMEDEAGYCATLDEAMGA